MLSWSLQMVFLEFFEALLGCAEVKNKRGAQSSAESLSEARSSLATSDGRISPKASQGPSPVVNLQLLFK